MAAKTDAETRWPGRPSTFCQKTNWCPLIGTFLLSLSFGIAKIDGLSGKEKGVGEKSTLIGSKSSILENFRKYFD